MEMPEQVSNEKRKNMAIIYGKQGLLFNCLSSTDIVLIAESYITGREDYVATIGAKLKLHSTFSFLRKNISTVNHGIVDHKTLSGFV